ncbi:MAG: HD-GYP domain-containing protein, partial [Halanaerobiales bacterium]
RVSKISYAIGKKINLKNKTLKILQQAALLHDLGKIDIPTDILYKPGRLTQEEFKLVKKHPQMSFNILEMLEVDNTVAKIVLQHHERLDGSGYPHGLKSKEIRPAAKILAVADVVEAMLSHRPYKLPLEVKKVVSELKTNRGKLYDKNVVDTCIELLKSGFVLD